MSAIEVRAALDAAADDDECLRILASQIELVRKFEKWLLEQRKARTVAMYVRGVDIGTIAVAAQVSDVWVSKQARGEGVPARRRPRRSPRP